MATMTAEPARKKRKLNDDEEDYVPSEDDNGSEYAPSDDDQENIKLRYTHLHRYP